MHGFEVQALYILTAIYPKKCNFLTATHKKVYNFLIYIITAIYLLLHFRGTLFLHNFFADLKSSSKTV